MAAEYDKIAEEYKESKQLAFREHIELYTYFAVIGELAGQSILDLGCGEGFYTRKFRQRGADRVVGVDVSEKMIELARQAEEKNPLGLEYVVRDAGALGEIGSFDFVVASYLLNYAQTKEQLLNLCRNIFINLKSGGRFVSINNNPDQPPESFPITKKYGFTKSISGPLQEGTPITYTFFRAGRKFNFDNYYLSIETHEKVFRRVGFKEIHWHKIRVSPKGLQEFGQAFWQDFIDYQPIIGIECMKP